MIELTVGLPVWNSKKIAWLALESLCNQKDVDFKWELIIMEEQINGFGVKEVAKYAERLKKAGCVSLKYFALDYKIGLPQKWREIALKSNKESRVFVFCAADDYYEPYKLKTSYDAIKKGHDWVHYRYCLMYDLASKKHIIFDCKSIGRECGNIAAAETESVRSLPDAYIDKGVDGWLYSSINPKNPFMDASDNWQQGFATDGLNNISTTRKRYYHNIQPPFFNTGLRIENIVNKGVQNKLNKSYG